MKALEEITAAVTAEAFRRARPMEGDDEATDTLLDGLLLAAQDVVEAGTNRPLTARNVEISLRVCGPLRWWFPCAPVESVAKIEWQDGSDWVELDISGVALEQAHDEPQLVLPEGFWAGVADGAAVRVTARVGYQSPPRPLSQAVILIAADWHEAGINPDKDKHMTVSFGCRVLMKQNRYRRPKEWGAV